MSIKHKVLQDFQFVQPGKKILILKAKTILEDYTYQTKNEVAIVPQSIVDSNPEFFSLIDWKMEFQSHIRALKLAQPAILAKKLIPFIETLLLESNPSSIDDSDISNQLAKKDVEISNRDTEISKNIDEIKSKNLELSDIKKLLDSKEDELLSKQNLIETLEKRIVELESLVQDNPVLDDYVPKSRIFDIVDGFRRSGFSTEIFDSLLKQL